VSEASPTKAMKPLLVPSLAIKLADLRLKQPAAAN
jgi:hypothetical protein